MTITPPARPLPRGAPRVASEPLDEPLVVVGVDERGDTLSEVVDILEELGPQAPLLERPHERLGDAVALGLADEGGVVDDAEPADRSLEVLGAILGEFNQSSQHQLAGPRVGTR